MLALGVVGVLNEKIDVIAKRNNPLCISDIYLNSLNVSFSVGRGGAGGGGAVGVLNEKIYGI